MKNTSEQGERKRRIAFFHAYAENDPEVLPPGIPP
jgi:hypothetical protein